VKINDVEGEVSLQRAKCPPTIGHNGFEEKWENFLLEVISMLFNSIDIFHIRFMVR